LIYLNAAVASQVRTCYPDPLEDCGENSDADRSSIELDVVSHAGSDRFRGGGQRHARFTCRDGDDPN